MVRVIAGTLKGRRLKVSSGRSSRPTADRVKEALFNILASGIGGSKFLDLFAGSGNVGIEALSRGAERVFFVEKDHRLVEIIYNNLISLSLTFYARVIKKDVFIALKEFCKKGERFDLIFLDPPYDRRLELPVLEAVTEYSLLKPAGIIIVESSKREVLPPKIKSLVLLRQEKYGDTLLTFFKEG